MTYKLGSLFDGSGGFPLAGSMCGITPAWASEVEPYPIAVTRSRFPGMKHLGDISKINGGEVEPVDIITFGSPCQDLSVAGKRAGLKHEANGDDETTRSGLFMEAVRIIKEMRGATNGRYPAYALWENVPGAFSSNKGEDFRIVLQELIQIVEPGAVMPAVPKNGWPYADSYVGEGWSLSYRVFDAQYWGVPQRRRRIHLVLDLRGERAREVLFERDRLYRNSAPCGTPWQETASYVEGGSGADDRAGIGGGAVDADIYNLAVTGDVVGSLTAEGYSSTGSSPKVLVPVPNLLLDDQGGQQVNVRTDDKCPTLRAEAHGNVPAVVAYSFDSLASNSMKSKNPNSGCRQVEVAKCLDTTDPNPSKNQGGIAIVEQNVFCKSARPRSADDATVWKDAKVANTLNTFDLGETRCNELVVEEAPVYCLQGNGIDRADTAGCNGKGWKEDVCYTLNTIDRPAVAYGFFPQRKAEGQSLTEEVSVTLTNGTNPGDQNAVVQVQNTDARARIHPTDEEVHEFIADNNADAPHQQDLLQAADSVARTIACGTHAAGSHLTKTVINYGTHYIVRRLTPTECARLQGFPDKWGHPEQKDIMTPEEARFWVEVQQTNAVINGKKPWKDDVKTATILKWYNSLHTDSAEYKMWGNGIALPPALYCMQGIRDALDAQEDATDLSDAPEEVKHEIIANDEALREAACGSVVEDVAAEDEADAGQELTKSELISALAKVYRQRKRLTRQQVRTLRGQIMVGDVDGAMRGLEKLLKREGL